MQSWNAAFYSSSFLLLAIRCGGKKIAGSGRVQALNLTVPLGSGQMISGTGQVRASV